MEIMRNILAITLICLWVIFLSLGYTKYEFIYSFLNSFLGKFFVLSLSWTFSFHILNEIRHLFWDLGYGFDLKIANITGVLTLIGSFIFTVIIFIIGKNLL